MTAKKTVLIIDDEPDTLTYFSSLLQDEGFETMVAENGDAALKKVATAKPDLITLDITMPETSGVRCYRELRANDAYRDIPVIMITGVSEKFQDFISSRKQVPPPDGYLTKPIEEKDLIAMARKLTS